MFRVIQESKREGKRKVREREREQMLHNNDCIVEYNSKLCLITAQMYKKVHLHRGYCSFGTNLNGKRATKFLFKSSSSVL